MTLKNIPDELHHEFKVYAVTKGSNIKAEILRLMQEAIDKAKAKAKK